VTNLPPNLRRSRSSAMTLAEVVVALGVMAVVMAGILATFMQTRRLAAASVAQNCAVTIVQGYVEQLKGLKLHDFVNANSLPTPRKIPN
jgi:type II secretory pathway pseudopilin PulG